MWIQQAGRGRPAVSGSAAVRVDLSGRCCGRWAFAPSAPVLVAIGAENAGRPIALVDRDALIRLLLEHYEDLEAEFKAIVPLREVHIQGLGYRWGSSNRRAHLYFHRFPAAICGRCGD